MNDGITVPVMDSPEHYIMWDKAQILDREDNQTGRIKEALRIRDFDNITNLDNGLQLNPIWFY